MPRPNALPLPFPPAALTIPLVVYLQTSPQTLLAAAVIDTLLIVFAHRGNIGRLMSGTESKFT